MARRMGPFYIGVIAEDRCKYESCVSNFDPKESFELLSSILELFERMREKKIGNLNIAIFESGSKGFIPGNLIETLDFSKYYNPKHLSSFENQLIFSEKHYTRIDLVSNREYAEVVIYKRICILRSSEFKKHLRYLTKVFCASGMELVEISKLMNQAGITSEHLKNLLEEKIRKITSKNQ